VKTKRRSFRSLIQMSSSDVREPNVSATRFAAAFMSGVTLPHHRCPHRNEKRNFSSVVHTICVVKAVVRQRKSTKESVGNQNPRKLSIQRRCEQTSIYCTPSTGAFLGSSPALRWLWGTSMVSLRSSRLRLRNPFTIRKRQVVNRWYMEARDDV
jgi:hypothetical protein